jgi:hypothetical protein
MGAWESLNYVIRFLKEHDKEESIVEFRSLKEQLEEGVAVDFQRKLTMI